MGFWGTSLFRGNVKLDTLILLMTTNLMSFANAGDLNSTVPTIDTHRLEEMSNDSNITFQDSKISDLSPEEFFSFPLKSWSQWISQFNRANLKHSESYTIFISVLYLIVFVIGILGNIVVVLVIILRPGMRTVTNFFILNLAVADLSVLFFCLPATLLANVYTPWLLGSFMCSAVAYVQGVSVIASAYSLVAITMDRCRAICHNILSIQGFSKRQTFQIVAFIWAIALTIPVPWLHVFEIHQADKNGFDYCVESWGENLHGVLYFLVANLFLGYFLPVLLIAMANVYIWWKVSHRTLPRDISSSLESINRIQEIHRKTQRGVGKMLGIVTSAFLLSWLPLYVVAATVKLSPSLGDSGKSVVRELVPLAQWLAYGNSCMNPVLYAFFNSNFRKMCKSLLPRWVLRNCNKFCRAKHGRPVILELKSIQRRTDMEHNVLVLSITNTPVTSPFPHHQNKRPIQRTGIFNGARIASEVGRGARRASVSV